MARTPFFTARTTNAGTTWRFLPSPKYRRAGFRAFGYYKNGAPVPVTEWAARGFSADVVLMLHLHRITLDGQPMQEGEALDIAKALCDWMMQHADAAPKGRAQSRQAPRSIDRLMDEFLADKDAQARAGNIKPKTVTGYRERRDLISKVFGDMAPGALTEDIIRNWVALEKAGRGDRQGYYMYQTLRAVFYWGRGQTAWKPYMPDIEWRACNIKPPKRRKRLITKSEFLALMTAAERPDLIPDLNEGRPWHGQPIFVIADAMILGMGTTQRKEDLLDLNYSDIAENRLSIEQSKRGAEIDIALLPKVRGRIATIRDRHKAMGVDHFQKWLVIDRVKKPFGELYDGGRGYFSELFGIVRARAERIEPSVATIHFRDVRRTAIQSLFDSGLDFPDVRLWSGHSYKSAPQVMGTYNPGSRRQADRVATAVNSDQDGITGFLSDPE